MWARRGNRTRNRLYFKRQLTTDGLRLANFRALVHIGIFSQIVGPSLAMLVSPVQMSLYVNRRSRSLVQPPTRLPSSRSLCTLSCGPSADSRPTPAWWVNQKFSLFMHWGLYAVPSYCPVQASQHTCYAEHFWDTVRALPGRLSALSVFRFKSVLYGAFVWARRALKHQKRRFPARAVAQQRLGAAAVHGAELRRQVRVPGLRAHVHVRQLRPDGVGEALQGVRRAGGPQIT